MQDAEVTRKNAVQKILQNKVYLNINYSAFKTRGLCFACNACFTMLCSAGTFNG